MSEPRRKYNMIRELADQGMAILCISSDLPEVLAMSDRVLVMREGRQMGILDGPQATQITIMSLAMGELQETVSPIQGLRPEKLRELVLLILIVLVLIVFSSVIENYLNARLFNRVSASVALMAVLAIGQTMVVLTRNIDLSVGSIVGFQLILWGISYHSMVICIHCWQFSRSRSWNVDGGINGILVAYCRNSLHHCHLGHNGSLPYFVGGIFRRSDRIDCQSSKMAA